MQTLVKKYTFKAIGIILLAVGFVGMYGIVSYSPTNNSINTAGVGETTKIATFASYYADFAIQILGISSILITLTIVGWGYKMVKDGTLSLIKIKFIFTVLSIVGFSTGISLFNQFLSDGIINVPLGGVLGQFIWTSITDIFSAYSAIIALLFLFLSLPLYFYGIAVDRQEWRFCFNQTKLAFAHLMSMLGMRERMNYRAEPNLTDDAKMQPQVRRNRFCNKKDKQVEKNAQGGFATINKTTPQSDRTPPVKSLRTSANKKPRKIANNDDFQLPHSGLLNEAPAIKKSSLSEDQQQQNARHLEKVFAEFSVKGEIKSVNSGPIVTTYELEPAPGIRTSRVISLTDDIARTMGAQSVRICAIPGKTFIGIEMPNPKPETVFYKDLIDAPQFSKNDYRLPIVLGKSIDGSFKIVDLAAMPHLLIAGTTGSGKSVGLNAMILSLLFKYSPTELRMIMVDPKMLEFTMYENIPHLLTPVVTDSKKAVVALKWAVREMEERYKKMAKIGVRNILGYNDRIAEMERTGEIITTTVQEGFDKSGNPVFSESPLELEKMPYIVVIVDEMADLMLVAGKDIEASIQRLAQMARASGIHIIMATQRPSVDVITGTIKANFPSRISYMVHRSVLK